METRDLNFSDTPRIGDIAETLLQRLPPRFGSRFVYALAAFTLLSILCLLFLRRRYLYIGIIALVIAFAVAVVPGRDPDTKFTLTFNPDRWQDSSTWRQTNTGGATLAGPAIDRAALDGVNQTFEPVDFSNCQHRAELNFRLRFDILGMDAVLVLFATAFFSMLGTFDNYKEENILDFFKDLFSNSRQ